MRTKKDIIFSTATIVLGIIPFVVLAMVVVADFASLGSENLGIIGGADGPTVSLRVQFTLQDFIRNNHIFASLLYIALPLILSGIFYLIFTKFVKQNCTIKTSAVALAISASAGLGMYCFFCLAILNAFGGVNESPIMYPAAIIFGILSFAAFIGLIVWYVISRKKNMSVKGIIIDVVTSAIFAPSFFLVFSCIHEILRDIIRTR